MGFGRECELGSADHRSRRRRFKDIEQRAEAAQYTAKIKTVPFLLQQLKMFERVVRSTVIAARGV